jgi:hypothetical protein
MHRLIPLRAIFSVALDYARACIFRRTIGRGSPRIAALGTTPGSGIASNLNSRRRRIEVRLEHRFYHLLFGYWGVNAWPNTQSPTLRPCAMPSVLSNSQWIPR